ncbi:MAG TPA: hypothetical protein VGI68_24330, partial [Mycobacterium sp.]
IKPKPTTSKHHTKHYTNNTQNRKNRPLLHPPRENARVSCTLASISLSETSDWRLPAAGRVLMN